MTVHHFVSDQDQDLRFLAHVLRKADEIREDLGSANELFDEAARRRLVDGESAPLVQGDLDRRILQARGRAAIEADDTVAPGGDGTSAGENLRALAEEIDLDPVTLRDTLEAAMAIGSGRPQLDCAPAHTCRVVNPGLPGWSELIDDSLRRRTRTSSLGPVPRIAFSTEPFLDYVGGRQVFRPKPDMLLMHLSHPMMQRALSALVRRRFPGTGDEVSRWTVRRSSLPVGADGVVVFSIEELAVNDLREMFHHWVRIAAFPVSRGVLGAPWPVAAARALRDGRPARDEHSRERAREIFEDVEADLKTYLVRHAEDLTVNLRSVLEQVGAQARRDEDERYRSRQGEVSALIEENTLAKLEREIARLKHEKQQGMLFDADQRLEDIERSIEEKQEEIKRRTRHYEEVRGQLERERQRILGHLLPMRHAMAGEAQAFPVCIEVHLPEEAR